MSRIRIVVGLLYLLSALAIIFSPVFRCGWQRFVSAAIFLALAASYAPSWHGHMFIYYNLAGCLFLIAFVQVLLPVWFSIKVGKVPLFLGGLCFSLIFFLAYSYVVALFCGFLLVSCMKKAGISRNNQLTRAIEVGGNHHTFCILTYLYHNIIV